jgi:peroxiredoxin
LGAAKPAKVKLEPFMADQSHRPATPGKNNLGPLLDKPAPEIRCSDWVNSVPLTLESLRGKVVVLTFWGGFDESPLGISRMEELRALHDLYRGVDDVAVVAVHDHSIDWSEVENYVQTLRLRFPVGRDAEPFVTFVNYNVNFIPQTVIIDKEGILRYFEVEGRIPELIKALRRAGV